MNCIIIDDDKLSCKILESFVEKTDSLSLQNTFENPVEALNNISDFSDIDLVFLDIEMPHMTGLDFLSAVEKKPQVIIVSSKEKYAINAFDFDVTDYFLKPVTYARFFKGINKAKEFFAGNNNTPEEKVTVEETTTEDGFFFKENNSIIRLKFMDILWIEALENYVSLCTHDSKYTIHQNLKSIENTLPSSIFRRVHRSFMVNLQNLKMIEDNSLIYTTKNGKIRIPIGKSYREKLLSNLNMLK